MAKKNLNLNKPKTFEIIFESLVFHWPFDSLFFNYFKIFRLSEPSTFLFQNKTYHYFYHKYNQTWRNERAIEIPIVKKIFNEYCEKNILEIGNVLSHYFKTGHDILDKYERGKNVINQDVVNFTSPEKYDLIVSISTIEHVGWDENPKESRKFLAMLENLKKHLTATGKIVITFPLGYNPELDKSFTQGNLGLTQAYCLKKISAFNKWQEIKCQDINLTKLHQSHHLGNIVVIGIIG